MTCVLSLFAGYWNVFRCPQYILYTLACTVTGSSTLLSFLPSFPGGCGDTTGGCGDTTGGCGDTTGGCGDTTGGCGDKYVYIQQYEYRE